MQTHAGHSIDSISFCTLWPWCDLWPRPKTISTTRRITYPKVIPLKILGSFFFSYAATKTELHTDRETPMKALLPRLSSAWVIDRTCIICCSRVNRFYARVQHGDDGYPDACSCDEDDRVGVRVDRLSHGAAWSSVRYLPRRNVRWKYPSDMIRLNHILLCPRRGGGIINRARLSVRPSVCRVRGVPRPNSRTESLGSPKLAGWKVKDTSNP